MITKVLGEEPPLDVVASLWHKNFATAHEARQAARLIYKLCRASIRDGTVRAATKRLIRQNAASRLYSLGYVLRRQGVPALAVLGLAWRADAIWMSRVAARYAWDQLASHFGGARTTA